MACFKLSFLEHLFSVPTKRYWTQLSEHTPFPQPLLFHCYPKRKGKLWKLTEWLISSSVRHTNTAGNNRPTIFSHAFFCNLADNLSLAQINAFAPHLAHLPAEYFQNVASIYQLKVAAQTTVLYLLNLRFFDFDAFKNSSTKVTFLVLCNEYALYLSSVLTVSFKAICGMHIFININL